MITPLNIFAICLIGCFFTWFMFGPLMEAMFDWFDNADWGFTLMAVILVPPVAFAFCFFAWPLVLLTAFIARRI